MLMKKHQKGSRRKTTSAATALEKLISEDQVLLLMDKTRKNKRKSIQGLSPALQYSVLCIRLKMMSQDGHKALPDLTPSSP
jgi:hypothetical protein